ncbi:hypothetical protein [Paracoccus sp. (in: a-proteobacteria)]|uniref:hypothetical protein n=1 Tax=Paracoccus sp. TaxID=267 RepID=UPI00333F573C
MDLRTGILSSAKALGINPVDLATAISYETAGTFDPTKAGPTTQWGQHRGLIQFGEPQAREYGVDWNDPIGSQLGEDGAVVRYLRKTGVQPGMGLLDIYSAINAGGVGRYGASDANNGGAPGTVRDKVEQQMTGHREKAMSLFGGDYTPPPIDQMQPVNGGSTMQQGLLNMIQKEDTRTLGQRLKDGAKDGSLWDALAMGFNTMRGPMADQGLAQSVGARMDQRQEQGKRNQTAEWLAAQGRQDLAEALVNGMISGDQAFAAMQPQPVKLQTFTGPDGTVYQFNQQTGETAPLTGAKDPSLMGSTPAEIQALEWRAKEAGLEPGTDEYRSFILNGGKAEGDEGPAAFQALHRQAIAAGFEPDSEEYRTFMATRGAGLAAEARAIGSAAGEAQASAESDYQTAQNALDLIDSIRNDPAIDRGTGKSSVFNAVPGTKGYDFNLKVEQAKGGAFLTAVQTMKGLGALSNNEGQAATAAITRMSTASTKEGFLSALDDYEKIVRQGLERAAAKGGGPAVPADVSDDDLLSKYGG